MKVALIGHGKMGRAIQALAPSHGFEVVAVFTRDRPLRADEATRASLRDVAVLIDFSTPSAVLENARSAASLSLPLVIGVTGWHGALDQVLGVIKASKIGAVRAANFSIGVNVLYRLAETAAALLAANGGYDAFINDWHHRLKLDSPSGTALELQRRMANRGLEREAPISSQRAGYIPSVHQVGFDSEADTIILEHRTRNRSGLAAGALLAARWISTRQGFHEFDEVIDELFHAGLAESRHPAD